MSVSYYYIVGDVVIVNGSFSDYTTNLSGGTPHPSVVPGRQLFTYSDIAVTGPAAMDCLVSHVHEQQHHLDLQTTSFGLLAWRVQRCITDDILAILREAQRAGIPFLREGASSRTGLRIVGLDGRPFLGWVTEVAPALKSGRCRIDLDSIVTGLRALLQFRDVLFGGPNVTIGEAVAVGNTALRYLRMRCDLDSTWTFTTSLPEDLQCVRKVQMPWNPTGGKVDGREVLELSAFLAECLFVDLVHGNPQMVTRWRTILGGVDRGWLIPFGDDSLPLQGAKNMFWLAAEYSLSGPGDPALRIDGTINIECVLPQWRLVHALEWLQGDVHSHPETLLVNDPIWDGPVSSHNIYGNLARHGSQWPRRLGRRHSRARRPFGLYEGHRSRRFLSRISARGVQAGLRSASGGSCRCRLADYSARGSFPPAVAGVLR